MEKIKLSRAVVVEGKYDKIKLTTFIDTEIIVVNGFGIYNDKKKLALIKKYAAKNGIIVLTDSDPAGFQLRNYLKSAIPAEQLIHAYIPDIFGKEKRKRNTSSAGTLGVEGVSAETILAALEKAGALDENAAESKDAPFTKAMLFDDGFIGGENSSERRKKLQAALDLPEHLSANALVAALNRFCSLEKYKEIINDINIK